MKTQFERDYELLTEDLDWTEHYRVHLALSAAADADDELAYHDELAYDRPRRNRTSLAVDQVPE